MSPPNPPSNRLLLTVTLVTIAIFGALVAGLTWWVRGALREEVLRRHAEAIQAVAMMHLESDEARLASFGSEFAIDDLFAAVLESSRLHGVLAVQLFDAQGKLRQARPIAPDEAAADRWWPSDLDQPQARFVPHGTLEMVSPLLAVKAPRAGSIPLLDVAVPLLRGATALGVARYWIDGDAVAAEFGRLDRRLAGQAAAAFAGAAVLAALVLWVAFTRLAEANRRLLEQSADLARANAELDFAAKTGALGAISAHLIHGLKNPLAGLEGFVADTAIAESDAGRGDAGRLAMETTRRLRALVNEVTTVLRDESGDAPSYAVPIGEIAEAARARTLALAESVQVTTTTSAEPNVAVDARTANLAGLVLANLLTNAIEASPPRSTVTLAARGAGENVEFVVHDAAGGLPETVQAALFRPVRSTKRGGGGMGLAISLRLAKHAGGDLQLVRSDGQGTVFRLVVPGARRP